MTTKSTPHTTAFLLLTLIIFSCTPPRVEKGALALIPKPEEQTAGEGYFELNDKIKVSVENQSQELIAKRFFEEFTATSGHQPAITKGGTGNITFKTDPELKKEAYILNVTPDNITLKASSGAGFFYALQSLKQLLPASFHRGELQKNVVWQVPSVHIKDAPAFGWRGYMLDVSRHFFDKEKVKEVLDFMAELKLNRFHWQMTRAGAWKSKATPN